ncbi:hypothetical protein HOG21_03200 [bacterium]|jgi:hypothetical protein|nr:hypothetical protein [bacterium]
MNEDNNRTITLILKEKSTEEKLLFECLFYLVNINPFKRIKVKLTKDKTLKNCNINCLIGDNHIYKIDKNNKSDNKSNEKYIVINYFNKNKSTDILNTLGFSKNMSREVKN